jgi:hypothetical protein
VRIEIPDGPHFIIACPQRAIVRADANFEDAARYMACGLTGKEYLINLGDEAVPEREIRMNYDDRAEVMPPHDLGGPPDWMPGDE